MQQKPKVFAFCGYGTNPKIMQFQMGPLHDKISNIVDIEYVQPRCQISRFDVDERLLQVIGEVLFIQKQDEILYRWELRDREYVIEKILQESNLVGFIGFSMGTIILQMIAIEAKTNPILREKCKFMIFFSANLFIPPKDQVQNWTSLSIPSLHTILYKDYLLISSYIQANMTQNPKIRSK
ncbi:hypothetical protein pb186bvf_018271 [Paramecium bursaria]